MKLELELSSHRMSRGGVFLGLCSQLLYFTGLFLAVLDIVWWVVLV